MGRKKLLEKLAEFFNMEKSIKEQKKDELYNLLSRLKVKEKSLKKEKEKEMDEKQIKRLTQKIEVVHTQRKKGIKMLKKIKAE